MKRVFYGVEHIVKVKTYSESEHLVKDLENIVNGQYHQIASQVYTERAKGLVCGDRPLYGDYRPSDFVYVVPNKEDVIIFESDADVGVRHRKGDTIEASGKVGTIREVRHNLEEGTFYYYTDIATREIEEDGFSEKLEKKMKQEEENRERLKQLIAKLETEEKEDDFYSLHRSPVYNHSYQNNAEGGVPLVTAISLGFTLLGAVGVIVTAMIGIG